MVIFAAEKGDAGVRGVECGEVFGGFPCPEHGQWLVLHGGGGEGKGFGAAHVVERGEDSAGCECDQQKCRPAGGSHLFGYSTEWQCRRFTYRGLSTLLRFG